MGPALWKPPHSPGAYQELARWLEVLWVLIASVLASVSSVCSAPAALGRSPFLLLTSGAFREQDWRSCTGERWSPLLWSPPPGPPLSCTWCPATGAPPPLAWQAMWDSSSPWGLAGRPVSVALDTVLSLELLKETWGFLQAKEARPVSRETSERQGLATRGPCMCETKPPAGCRMVTCEHLPTLGPP